MALKPVGRVLCALGQWHRRGWNQHWLRAASMVWCSWPRPWGWACRTREWKRWVHAGPSFGERTTTTSVGELKKGGFFQSWSATFPLPSIGLGCIMLLGRLLPCVSTQSSCCRQMRRQRTKCNNVPLQFSPLRQRISFPLCCASHYRNDSRNMMYCTTSKQTNHPVHNYDAGYQPKQNAPLQRTKINMLQWQERSNIRVSFMGYLLLTEQ